MTPFETAIEKLAKPVNGAIVIQVAQFYDGELVLETVCRGYDHYVSLPDVVEYQGEASLPLAGFVKVSATVCGKTGWSSDSGYACYKSGACIAYAVLD
jgi:hypothetical protein